MPINFISKKLADNLNLQKIISNTSWLFFDRLIRIIVEFFVGVWLVRYLGPENYGIYSYAIAFVALFSPLTNLGLDQIVIRNLVIKKNLSKDSILSTVFILKIFGSIAAVLVSLIIILHLRPDDYLTHWLVIIISFGNVIKSFDTIDLWFQSQVKSKYTVIAKEISLLLVALLKISLILINAPVIYFAVAIVIEIIIGEFCLLIAYKIQGNIFKFGRFKWLYARKLLQDSWPLMLSGIGILIYMRIDQIMLGQMANIQEVGLYSAAVKLSESWYFVPMAIASSSFPIILEYRKKSLELYYEKIEDLFNLMAGLSYLVAIPCSLISNILINRIFGNDYYQAGLLLSLHIWSGLFITQGIARNLWIISENLTNFAFIATASGALANIYLNFILIPPYNALGATIATLISYAVADILTNFFFVKTRKIGLLSLRAMVMLKFFQKYILSRKSV